MDEEEEEESTIIRMAGSPLLTFTVTYTSNGGERKDEMCAVYKTILIDKKVQCTLPCTFNILGNEDLGEK